MPSILSAKKYPDTVSQSRHAYIYGSIYTIVLSSKPNTQGIGRQLLESGLYGSYRLLISGQYKTGD